MARVFNTDPITKTKRLFHWNEAEESFHIETLQDVTDIVEDNKGFANHFDERTGWKGDFHRVASIPMPIYMGLPKDLREDNKALLRWLDDSDQRAFRTRPGKLSR